MVPSGASKLGANGHFGPLELAFAPQRTQKERFAKS
ncbi:hypothetical protein PENARI_c006G06450 [Penicillium arizonense]|uniref:Uncharacterized protein n=1 Tax=Penicillium arizonense TaxID=1835702 RepID=A0A1F5LLT0_PENAI|nr:hypothetical protein PENARI_c006G06450 [Penicillium arizonense]OGE54163.1 hypothetical protein PENARI_c006G06450 [Penicillium arizonense]